jgi:F0F1-type ATP synthase assembly protein I
MEDLRVEYDLVTSYFSDIQTIEDLPANVRKDITDIAKKIAFLEGETSEFLHSDDRISDENFRMIQGMEKDLTQVFGELQELEDMEMKIKRDLKQLEIEKNNQEYIQDTVEERQSRLRVFMLAFGTAAVALVVILAIVGILTEVNMLIPVLLILLVVVGMAALTIVTYRRLSYEFKMAELRENRAINLTNKVKIKYINNTSTLDYLYSKYNIKSLRELEYLYEQYLIMVDEIRKYKKSSGSLREYTEALTKLLFSYGVKDPDIWSKQSQALIDNREMVEVKHSLNVRRQKLREQIAYNEQLRLNGLKDIREMLESNPELRSQVKKSLELYHINIQ